MPTKRKKKNNKKLLKKYLILLGIGIVLIALVFFIYNTVYGASVVYKGTTPCADCPGIDQTLTFYNNGTYSDKNVYQDRNISYIGKGTWALVKGIKTDPNASVYELIPDKGAGTQKSYYLLEGDKIRPLDAGLNKLPSPYDAPLRKQ